MYRPRLPPSMSRLHPVFNVIKLTLGPEDPIPGQCPRPPPLLEIVNGEKEFIMEKILDSQIINRRLCYLIKWEGYGIEHNSWEPADNVHAPECVTEFHRNHPGAPHNIRFADFDTIPFRTLSSVVPRRHSLEGGVDVRGHPFRPPSPTLTEYLCLITLDISHLSNTLYVPPHRR